jgi:Fe2+ or Zn2+ uptake regulation protein
VTPQRLTVYRALAGDPTHPTADTLHARVRPGMPSLSLATVYRILESLEREGLVRRVSTVDGVARFDANLAPHQHVVCRVCGQIMDIEVKTLAEVSLPRVGIPGFVAEALDIRILGTCASCEGGPSSPARRSRKPRRSK